MKRNNLDQPLKATLEELKVYLDLQIKRNKVVFGKKAEEFLSQLFIVMILSGVAAFFLLFLTFGFVHWYASFSHNVWGGFLIASGFYLFVGLFIYLFRNSLINKPFRKKINGELLDGETDLPGGINFSDKLFLDRYMKILKDKTEKQEAVVKQSFQKLNESLSVENLTRELITKAYHSFLTTKNIAKAIYLLTSKLKGKRHKRSRKKLTE